MDWGTAWVALHVTGTLLGVGGSTAVDVSFWRSLKNWEHPSAFSKMLRTFCLVIWTGVILLVLSGVGLLLSSPETYIHSEKFLSKMVIVLVLLINGAFLHVFVTPRVLGLGRQDWLERGEKFYRAMRLAIPGGVVSIVSWYGALVLGAAGDQPWTLSQVLSGYLGTIAGGTITGSLACHWINARRRGRSRLVPRPVLSRQASQPSSHLLRKWRLGKRARAYKL